MNTRLYKILAISILALLAASCQKEELYPQGEGFTATAVICESVATKVDYSTDEEANVVTQQWALNDVVFGFDNLGQTFTFNVTSINENSGKATFSLNEYEPNGATRAYAVFYPGKSGFSADGTLDVDLTSQNGILSTETPVLMCATAEIKGNKVEFSFTNQTAVIEVKKFQIEPGKTVNSLEIGGLVATGKFVIEDGELILVPDADPSTITANVNLTADGEGIVDTPVYFAALPTHGANITVSAISGSKKYENANAIPVTNVQAGHLYYMSKKLAEVARIGNATYSSIFDAIAACAASHVRQTVTILRDFAETERINIPSTGMTLDLAGHDVEARISVDSELEIKDSGEGGILRYTDDNVIKVNAGGKLTMTGGTVKAEYVGLKRSAIYILGSSSKKAEAVFNGGTVTGNNYRGALECQYAKVDINGGTFNGYTPINVWRYSDVTVNDAIVECTEPSQNHGECIYFCTEYITTSGSNQGSMDDVNVVLNGGSFKANGQPMFKHANADDVSENALVEIHGGFFEWPSGNDLMSAGAKANIDLTIAGGHFKNKAYDNFFEEGEWFIPCKFSCDDRGHESLYDAFSEAQQAGHGTVKMFADWTMLSDDGNIALSAGDYILDMQGHELTVNLKRINVSGGTLSIKSTGKNATYRQATGNNFLMKITGGTVSADNVDFICTADAAAFSVAPVTGKSAKFILDGGSINDETKAAISAAANSEIEINGGEVTSGKSNAVLATSATININGGDVTSGTTNAIAGTNATVNINGGKMSASGNHTVSLSSCASTVTGGELTNSAAYNALYCKGTSDVNISGGTFTSEDLHAVRSEESTKLTITNGTFHSEKHCALNAINQSNVTVSGGSFSSSGSGAAVYFSGSGSSTTIINGSFESSISNAVSASTNSDVTISGGTYRSGTATTLYASASKVKVTDGDFYSASAIAMTCEDNADVHVEGGRFETGKGSAVYVNGSKIEVTNGTFTSPNHAINCEPNDDDDNVVVSTAKITGGTFTSTSATSYNAGRFKQSKVSITGGTFVSNNTAALNFIDCDDSSFITDGSFTSTKASALIIGGGTIAVNGGTFNSTNETALTVDGYSITINGGHFHSSNNYALLLQNGGNATIGGGSFVADSKTAVYLTGTTSNTLTINGGAFICNNTPSNVDAYNGFALYAGGSNHDVSVTSNVSEPYFYTASTAASPIYRNSSSSTIAVTAGYFNKDKIGAGTVQYYDANTHMVNKLSPAKTLTVDGKNYSFGWQLISK